jgi:hypothetical protein
MRVFLTESQGICGLLTGGNFVHSVFIIKKQAVLMRHIEYRMSVSLIDGEIKD